MGSLSQAIDPFAYAIVEQVQIEAVDENTVTFATRAQDGSRRSFTVGVADILRDAPTSVLLEVGRIGDLYLSENGWRVTANDGSGLLIYGAGDDQIMEFKYPEYAGAMAYYSPKAVSPQKIIIKGLYKDRGAGGAPTRALPDEGLDIWSDGEPSQEIHWSCAAYIRLRVKPDAVATHNLSSGDIEVWPTQIVVRGEAVDAPGFVLELDLLDRLLARATQDLVWTSPGSKITLYLTPEGCARSGVVPGGISQIANGTRWYGDLELVERVNKLRDRLDRKQCALLDRARERLGGLGSAPAVRRITIVGKAAPGVSQPNSFLDQVLKKLRPPDAPSASRMREVFEASSVQDIQQILLQVIEQTPLAQISLQLISHADSGILWLGHYGDAASDALPYYYLDSDPDALVYLSQFGRAGKLADVTVVGCDVAAAASAGNGYNGRALMYTLAELFRCRVVGATDAVHYSEFDENGDYKPGPEHSGLIGWQWHPDREPEYLPDPRVVSRPRAIPSESFSITAIHSASLHAPYQKHGGAGQPLDLKRPVRVQGQEEKDASLQFLAAAISVTVQTEQGTLEQAAVLRGGQILRVGTSHYRISDGDTLFKTLRNQLEDGRLIGPRRSYGVAPAARPTSGPVAAILGPHKNGKSGNHPIPGHPI